jgi:hypothetical protein
VAETTERSQMEEGSARQHSHVAGLLDREHSGTDQVHHAQSLIQAEGREGLAEVREGAQAQGQD